MLVDGFNLYFGLRAKHGRKYLWLDLDAMARRLLKPHQTLVEVRYFTARVRNNPKAEARQNTYLSALATRPAVTIIEGRFNEKTGHCHGCGNTWRTYEEKESDVNVAITLTAGALNDDFDTALVVSADSDLCPAMKAAKAYAPAKRIVAVFPPKRSSFEVRQTADASFTLSTTVVRQCQLPDPVTDASGKAHVRPARWS